MSNNTPFQVLIVDDDPTLSKLLHVAARAEMLQCDHAADGSEALNCTKQRDYDAVITDLHMPGMNGHALVVSLLQNPTPPLIFVVTGVEEPKIIRDLILRGVDTVMLKPLNCTILAAMVSAKLKRRQATSAEAHGACPRQVADLPDGEASAHSHSEDSFRRTLSDSPMPLTLSLDPSDRC